MNSSHASHNFSCVCNDDTKGTGTRNPQTTGATRRGFLSSLIATSTTVGLSGTLAGCQTVENIFGSAPAVKSSRIDIHHHMVPPSYAADMKRMGLGGVPRWTPQMSIDDMDKNDIATSVLALIQPGAFFKNVTTDRRIAREEALRFIREQQGPDWHIEVQETVELGGSVVVRALAGGQVLDPKGHVVRHA